MTKEKFKQATMKSFKAFKSMMPMMVGILMLISILNLYLQNYYSKIFTGNIFLDPLIGALSGSISFGIPITSYIVGGELLKQGVSLLAITAFIMAWTTVGVAMLPLEASFLGKRFAISRNIVNFIFSLIIAILVIYTLRII
ncbi:hypothetical protein D4R87_01345 [bacterium]|nr:MAG: hypothetical protein D4R87_01345 [bacterium]